MRRKSNRNMQKPTKEWVIATAAIVLVFLAVCLYVLGRDPTPNFDDFGKIIANLPVDRTVPQRFTLTGQGSTMWFNEGYAMASAWSLSGEFLWEGSAYAEDHTSESRMTGFSADINVGDYEGLAYIVIRGYNAEDDGRGDPEYVVRVMFKAEP